MNTDQDFSGLMDRLKEFYAANRPERLYPVLLSSIEDPLKPRTEAGRLRINQILFWLASLAVLAIVTFIFFTVVKP